MDRTGSDLRVLAEKSSKKGWKCPETAEKIRSPQLITRRSQVQILPPQPKKTLESLVFPGFFHVQKKEFPLFFPYQVSFLSQNINVFLHSDSAVAFHFLGHMAINVQSKGCGMMPQIFLNGLDIISAL